jgi:hypothetical protein
MIDTKSQEIRPQDEETYTDLLELADELPDSSPRFILLSHPLTLVADTTLLVRDYLLTVRNRLPAGSPCPTSSFTTFQ